MTHIITTINNQERRDQGWSIYLFYFGWQCINYQPRRLRVRNEAVVRIKSWSMILDELCDVLNAELSRWSILCLRNIQDILIGKFVIPCFPCILSDYVCCQQLTHQCLFTFCTQMGSYTLKIMEPWIPPHILYSPSCNLWVTFWNQPDKFPKLERALAVQSKNHGTSAKYAECLSINLAWSCVSFWSDDQPC